MKLPSNVKAKDRPWNIFPFSKYTSQAIYPNIYFVKEVFENLKSDNPKSKYVAALKHEQTHIKRQKETGWIRWGFKYLISSTYRFNEELEAIKSSMKYLKRKGVNYDTSKTAKYLSSWLYLWCVSYEKAKEDLDRTWEDS